jgi:Ca-activated chloride channel homolog
MRALMRSKVLNRKQDRDGEYSFAYPEFLWLLLLIPAMTAWYVWRQHRNHPSLQVPGIPVAGGCSGYLPSLSEAYPICIPDACRSLLIIVLARPQTHDQWEELVTEGIDIIISLDISSSMLAEDFSRTAWRLPGK